VHFLEIEVPKTNTIGLALVASLFAPRAAALNPALDISQYAHATWKLEEGFFKGAVHSIAQTPDGFLWLGTEFGAGALRWRKARRVAD
jgi:hypothetical protein